MNKHTPGPWIIEYDLRKKQFVVLVRAHGVPDKYCIARLPRTFSTQENKANARLVAAAPEMFEVCELLLKSERLYRGNANDRERACDALAEATAKAQAAIERVRGEE
jgi:hypothetical protein